MFFLPPFVKGSILRKVATLEVDFSAAVDEYSHIDLTLRNGK